MTSFAAARAACKTSTAEALAIFDGLDTIGIDFMWGAWRGTGFPTGHPLDGALEAYRWHGKRFDGPEDAHPLIFRRRSGRLVSVSPAGARLAAGLLERLPVLKSNAAGRIGQAALPLLATRRSQARLRMTDYRGRSSATLVYDGVPIHDIFRKVDRDTVLGVMDLKGMEQPFFFVLERE